VTPSRTEVVSKKKDEKNGSRKKRDTDVSSDFSKKGRRQFQDGKGISLDRAKEKRRQRILVGRKGNNGGHHTLGQAFLSKLAYA